MPGYMTARGQQAHTAPSRYQQQRPPRPARPTHTGPSRERVAAPALPAPPPAAVATAPAVPAPQPEAPAAREDARAQAAATVTREALERRHPAWVEGLPLGAVLDEAAVEDHELLLDPAMLTAFARALISSATLDPRRYRAEARAYRQAQAARATRWMPGVVVEGATTGGAGEQGWKVLDIPAGQVPGSVLVAPVVRFPRWWVELVDGRVMVVEPVRALSFREMEAKVAEKPGLFNGMGVRRFWLELVRGETGVCTANRGG